MASVLTVSAQTITSTGIVVDRDQLPIVGAAVMVKGTTTGTVTDIDGRFRIESPQDASLLVSFIGYESQDVTPGENLNVVLVDDFVMMQETIVVGVGYGSMRKSDLTGAIASVSQKDLKKGVITSAEQLLQGKVAGLNVTQSSSDPAAGASMRLRGGTSLSASNSPLVVVDGIPGVDMNTVQPSEIVSMDVLKDASAAAIYGSRGANGVIIVTTNRTESDVEHRNIEYNGYVSVGTPMKNIDMLSANQWRKYVRDNNIAGAIDYGYDTDWIKELERTATSHQHNIFMSSSRKSSGFRASLSYQNTEGVIKENYLKRLAGSTSGYMYGLNDKLKLDVGVSATVDKYRQPSTGFYGLFNYAMNQNPTAPVIDANGNWSNINGTNVINPVELNQNQSNEQTRYRVLLYGKGDLEIVDGLHAVANVSYEYNSQQQRYYQPSYALQQNEGGYGYRHLADYVNKQVETYLTYDKSFAEDQKLNVMAGYSFLDNVYEGFGAERRGFDSDAFTFNNLAAGSDYRAGDVYSYKGEAKLASFFGRVNYSAFNKYMLTATLRGDGSSRFGDNNKWGLFPSASVAWRLSEEDFLYGLEALDNLKLRAGFGVTGNQDGIGEYKSLALMGTVGGSYYDASTDTWKNSYAPSQNANPDLKWESTKQFNIGLDFGLLRRLNGTVEFYIKKTSDLLWTYQVSQPPYLYSSMLANVGDLKNSGVEITLNGNLIQKNDLSWDATLTFSYNKQKITKLSNDEFQDVGTPTGGIHGISGLSSTYTQMVKEGYPTGAFFGPRFLGTDDDGNFIVSDKNEYLGSAMPKVNLGFSTSLNYKGFDLTLSGYGMFGQKILNVTAMGLSYEGRMPAQNVTDDYIKGNLHPTTITYCDHWIENGSFFRFQNVTLGHSWNFKEMGINKMRIYATVDNICTLTGYSGVDPEIATSGLDAPGIDMMNVYPRTRSFIVGVNLNF